MFHNVHFFSTRNLVDLDFHSEHLTKGVGRPAVILADVRDFASDAFEVLLLPH